MNKTVKTALLCVAVLISFVLGIVSAKIMLEPIETKGLPPDTIGPGDPPPELLDPALVEAIRKLPKNTWLRPELQKVGLEDLWDAMNQYRVDELVAEGKWGKYLKEAGRMDIVEAAELAKLNNINHGRQNYCAHPNDVSITVSKYVEYLPKEPEPEVVKKVTDKGSNSSGGKSTDRKSTGGKPAGGNPAGGKSTGGKPAGDNPAGVKPGQGSFD